MKIVHITLQQYQIIYPQMCVNYCALWYSLLDVYIAVCTKIDTHLRVDLLQ